MITADSQDQAQQRLLNLQQFHHQTHQLQHWSRSYRCGRLAERRCRGSGARDAQSTG